MYLSEEDIKLAITKATEKIQKTGASRGAQTQRDPLPEGDIKWLRKQLRKQELAAGPWLRRSFRLGRTAGGGSLSRRGSGIGKAEADLGLEHHRCAKYL